jgi:hypothetical protein
LPWPIHKHSLPAEKQAVIDVTRRYAQIVEKAVGATGPLSRRRFWTHGQQTPRSTVVVVSARERLRFWRDVDVAIVNDRAGEQVETNDREGECLYTRTQRAGGDAWPHREVR